jgi:formylglycine-generating enzyme required for sulfatase activity
LHELGGKAKLSDATIVDLGVLWQRLAQQLAEVVEGTLLPATDRVRAGVLLGNVGDLRPGVCAVNDIPWVTFVGGEFVIGLLPEELEPFAQQYFTDRQAAGNEIDDSLRKGLYGVLPDWVNDQPRTVAPFAVARYPVTNAQYQRFMEADGYNREAPWWDAAGRAWLGRDDANTEGLESWQRREHKHQPEFWTTPEYGSDRSNHPVVGISWYEATAFAKWLTQHLQDGFIYRLPSELEWEYAARGTERRMYPWGDSAPDDEQANFNRIYNGTTAVGCFPAGATPITKLMEMAGNVWEWTRSDYRPYPYDPDDGREDGTEPAKKSFTLRGGGWLNPSIYLRASFRDSLTPGRHYDGLGVRLARHRK